MIYGTLLGRRVTSNFILRGFWQQSRLEIAGNNWLEANAIIWHIDDDLN